MRFDLVFKVLMNLIRFRELKNPQISNSMNICPMEVELFYVDGQTDGWSEEQADMTKIIGSLSLFCQDA
jgi:hypothetical protein